MHHPDEEDGKSSPKRAAEKKLVIQEPTKNQPDPRRREERRGSLSSSTLSVSRHAFQAGRHAYHRRVSFDNSTNEAPSGYHSFVLRRSTQGFERTKRTRTFMIPVDLDGGPTDALRKTMRVSDETIFIWRILVRRMRNEHEGFSFFSQDFVDDDDMVVIVGAYSESKVVRYKRERDVSIDDNFILPENRNPSWPKEKADELMNILYELHQKEKAGVFNTD